MVKRKGRHTSGRTDLRNSFTAYALAGLGDEHTLNVYFNELLSVQRATLNIVPVSNLDVDFIWEILTTIFDRIRERVVRIFHKTVDLRKRVVSEMSLNS